MTSEERVDAAEIRCKEHEFRWSKMHEVLVEARARCAALEGCVRELRDALEDANDILVAYRIGKRAPGRALDRCLKRAEQGMGTIELIARADKAPSTQPEAKEGE